MNIRRSVVRILGVMGHRCLSYNTNGLRGINQKEGKIETGYLYNGVSRPKPLALSSQRRREPNATILDW